MSKEKKKTLAPKLRFPEFREAGNWVPRQLGSLFTERQETGFLELPLLSLTEKDGIIPQEETNRKNNSSSDKSKYLRICPGDVAYNTMRMWEGRSAFVDKEGLVSPAYTVCKPNDDVDGLFFSYYFKTHQLIKQFHRYSQGLVKDTLNLKFAGFSLVEAWSPKKPEQQKIAATLSTLDDLIAAQSEKIKALQAHKKGLMQQLFPAEGETVPRVRFGEFRESGEWESKELGEITTWNSGGTPSKDNPIYWGGDIPWISASSMRGTEYFDSKLKLTEAGLKNGSRLAKKGSLLLLVRGSMLFNCVPVGIAGRDVAFNQDLKSITVTKEVDTKYLLYWFLASEQLLMSMVGGTGIGAGKLETSELQKISVPLPTLPEQQKIAATLSSLDDLIAAQSEKLEALKSHKKGLMQGLFPNPGAV